ncbi:MAG: tetratricopeptide repeat protein [Chitinophagales bacterium]
MMQLLQKAQQAMQQQQYQLAAQYLHQFLLQKPQHANALHLLGVCYSQQGKYEQALQYLSQAIQRQAHPMFYHNLGRVYLQVNNLPQALGCFRMASSLSPNAAEAWFMLANTLKKMGRTKEAQQKYKKAIKADPRHSMTWYNWGNLLLEIGQYRSAKEKFEKSIAVRPNNSPALNNLGSACEQVEENEKAADYYLQSLQINPQYKEARRNLASNYDKRGYFHKAQEQLKTLAQESPHNNWINWQIETMQPIIFQSNEEINHHRQQLQSHLQSAFSNPPIFEPEAWQDHSPQPPFILNYQGRYERPLKEKIGQFWENYFQKIRQQLQAQHPPLSSNTQDKRPHIGFVVTNGHEGVFLKCMRGIVEHFDAKKFRLSIVCSAPVGEVILRQKIKRKDLQYVSMPKKLPQAVEVVRQAQFDLLHYWEVGSDFTNYFLPYFRLAKVQCATWGTPVTSGIPQMDYYLSCKLLETPDAQKHYTEKLIQLNRLPTYYYEPQCPKTSKNKSDFGLPANSPTYACVQNLRKVHPDMDELFRGILEEDKKGILLFIEDKQAHITALLQQRLQRNIPQHYHRIRFLKRMPAKDYLDFLQLSDVLLDTLHYTGGANTSYDAFAVGTPYVTLPTEYHRGRYGLAAYQQIGVTDAIAKDKADYIRLAVRIANDAHWREELSAKIRVNKQEVFEDKEAVRELEGFFESVVF